MYGLEIFGTMKICRIAILSKIHSVESPFLPKIHSVKSPFLPKIHSVKSPFSPKIHSVELMIRQINLT